MRFANNNYIIIYILLVVLLALIRITPFKDLNFRINVVALSWSAANIGSKFVV